MNALQDVVDYGIIGLLLALSVWAMAIAVERWLFYPRVDLAPYPDSLGLEMAPTRRLIIIGPVAANAPLFACWALCLVLCSLSIRWAPPVLWLSTRS